MFMSVGRKFILLLACSILNVYNGVVTVKELAVTQAAASSTALMPITARSIFLSILSPPFKAFMCKRLSMKMLSNFLRAKKSIYGDSVFNQN